MPLNKLRTHQAVERDVRRQQVIELYRQGLSQKQVAEHLHIAVGTVNADIKALREDVQAHSREDTEHYIEQQLADVGEIRKALLPKVKRGNEKAAMTLLAALNRQAKLLGIDGPDKKEISGPDGGPLTWREAMEQAEKSDSDEDDASQ